MQSYYQRKTGSMLYERSLWYQVVSLGAGTSLGSVYCMQGLVSLLYKNIKIKLLPNLECSPYSAKRI